MKVVIIGANGGTGRLAVAQALARGHQVVAYVRQAGALLDQPGLQIMVGKLSDVAALKTSLQGADAVLCCLGPKVSLQGFVRPQVLMQTNVPFIIQAMEQAQVKRLVLLSAYGVGAWAKTAGLVFRILFKTACATAYADKVASEAVLSKSGLEWTCVYPPLLTDEAPSGDIEVHAFEQVASVLGTPKVSRADVATAMLMAAADPSTIGQRLLVSSRGSVKCK